MIERETLAHYGNKHIENKYKKNKINNNKMKTLLAAAIKCVCIYFMLSTVAVQMVFYY